MNPLGLFQPAREDCFTTGSLPGVAILGSACILFTMGLSWSETSDSILTDPGDFRIFWVVLLHPHRRLSHLYQKNLETLVLFGDVSVYFFTAGLSVTVCCYMLPTEKSSPASFFICLALSLYVDSLAGSYLISFHLLDTILR